MKCRIVAVAILLICAVMVLGSCSEGTLSLPEGNRQLASVYGHFTDDALRQYLQNNSTSSVDDVRFLGSGTFRGSGHIQIEDAVDNAREYRMTFMCRPERDDTFSVFLKRGKNRQQILKSDGCGGRMISTVSYPVQSFPEAQFVSFSADDDMEFVVVVQEALREGVQ